jgi:hypothetical protein
VLRVRDSRLRLGSVSRPGYDGGDYVDNVILSRHPLSEITVHKVTESGWDYHQESVIVQAVVNFLGQRINLFAKLSF